MKPPSRDAIESWWAINHSSVHQQRRTKAGKKLQDLVNEADRYYLRNELAMVGQINTGMVPVGWLEGRQVFRPAKKVWNDNVGMIYPDESKGRLHAVPILVELKNRVKSTRDRRTLLIVNELRRKKKDKTWDWSQRDSLLKWQERGGEARVLLWTNFKGTADPVMSLHTVEHIMDRVDQATVEKRRVHIRNGIYDYLGLMG